MQNKLIWKILAFLILLVLVVSCATLSIAGDNNLTNTIYVPDDYAKIQWAVNNATAGDMIIVRDGTYTENIAVNKRLTIRSENGYATVQAANTNDSVFEVTADYVNISGFTVENSFSSAGISLNEVVHCNISNNNVSNNYRGINSSSGNFNLIADNIITDNKGEAICLYYGSNYNSVVGNNISNNTWGVWIGYYRSSSHNIVSDNIITDTKEYGAINVYGNGTTNNTILNNTVSNNIFGISLGNARNNTVMNNIATNNAHAGIGLYHSSNNVIEGNNASSNPYNGLYLSSSCNNSIKNNIANSNNGSGIFIYNFSTNNAIINNTASYNWGGITAYSSNYNIISNNNANFNEGDGISLNLSDYNAIRGNYANSNNGSGISLSHSSNNAVINNNARLNKYYGIFLYSSSYSTIADNDASFNGAGISLGDFSSNNTVTNNTVISNFLGGIDLSYSCDYNIISNNNASFNGGWSISLLSSDYNIIADNYAKSNNQTGIFLSDFSNNNTIRNNNASFNDFVGILLDSSDYNTITGNYANSNEGFGILLYNLSSNNIIKNNTANYNFFDGINIWNSSDNIIRNNNASFNKDSGTFLFSSNYNIVANNDLFSNSFGLTLMTFEFEGNNNQILNNTVNFNKYCGISLWDLRRSNNITHNNASNNNIFGMFVCNSTNQAINNNTVNSNDRGIGLHESRDIQAINNTASANKISGFSLIDSTNNTLLNNSASFNTYEGIFLSNSNTNTISTNNVSSNYFGISLSSSNDNNITDNSAESNYYFEVLLHNSSGNDIVNNTWYIQEDIVYGVSLHVTPSLQTAEDGINASYYIVAENLGNSPDTYDLVLSSTDNPEISSLDTDSIFLGAGEMSINTSITEVEIPQAKVKVVKPSVKTIILNVSDTEPGIYTVKVTVLSRHDNTVKDIIETRTIVPGQVDSVLINSPKITKSAIINSSINSSIISTSGIINSTISDSTITCSVITNSEVVSTFLDDVIVEDAVVFSGDIIRGNITLNEIRYEISNKTRIYDLILGSDHRDSNLVGIINKTLEINATNSGICFNISAKKDYFAGSMSVQKSSVPPDVVPELTNNVGGYVYTDVSENLNNSKSWVNISVNYNQNELGALDESSLKLRYFNETADAPGWEDIPISGINHMENYVWGNISHFSVFALIAQPPVDGGRDGGIRPLPEEIIIHIANPGINIFNFEWLGHDIIKISIDLKSVTINARMALKKRDKPAEFPDPPGIVYGYFDISTNIEPENIRASKIHFKILKSLTVVNDVNAETIKLWRYVNSWEELETLKIEEDDDYFYFSADTKGFSLFAITSEKRALDVTPIASPPTPTPTPIAPTPTPPIIPTASPIPSLTPVLPTMGIRLLIIAAIAASAMIVSVAYLLLRRRKKKLS